MHTLDFHFVEAGIVGPLDDPAWETVAPFTVQTLWSGDAAGHGRSFDVAGLWSYEELYIRFDCRQTEPLIIAEQPVTEIKSPQLWERDVCEAFIACDKSEPRKYLEFEVAPTGEWLDLAVDATSGSFVKDWKYDTGLRVDARIDEGRVLMAMAIPFRAFGKRPEDGEVWLGNLYRCVGNGPDRGMLAWSPTMTERPSFHVPEAFGEFHFVDRPN
jgi:hypothetical protein